MSPTASGPTDNGDVTSSPMQSSLWRPVDPLRLATHDGPADGAHVGPGMVSGSTGWDAGRPMLAGVLARMEDLRTPQVKATGATITYYPLLSVAGITQGSGMGRHEVDPFDLDELLREQMSEADRVMAALRGVPTEHHAIVRSRLPTLVPSEVGPDGRDLVLRIQVVWARAREMVVHVPMSPMGAGHVSL